MIVVVKFGNEEVAEVAVNPRDVEAGRVVVQLEPERVARAIVEPLSEEVMARLRARWRS